MVKCKLTTVEVNKQIRLATSDSVRKFLQHLSGSNVKVWHQHVSHVEMIPGDQINMTVGGEGYKKLQHLAHCSGLLALWRLYGIGPWRMPADRHRRKVMVARKHLYEDLKYDMEVMGSSPRFLGPVHGDPCGVLKPESVLRS